MTGMRFWGLGAKRARRAMGNEVRLREGHGPQGHKMSRRRFVAGGLGVVGVAALAARIWWVNANAFDYPEVHYAIGEWVDLDGAFTTYADEGTKGYSLRVSEAEIMTRATYVERYAEDPSQVAATGYDDVSSILCLTLDMKNTGSDEGGMYIYQMSLIPEGAVRAMRYQLDLWCTSNKNLTDSTATISLLKDSEFTVHIPYILYGSTEEAFQQEIDARRFKFIVSNAPTRNIIDIEVA